MAKFARKLKVGKTSAAKRATTALKGIHAKTMGSSQSKSMGGSGG